MFLTRILISIKIPVVTPISTTASDNFSVFPCSEPFCLRISSFHFYILYFILYERCSHQSECEKHPNINAFHRILLKLQKSIINVAVLKRELFHMQTKIDIHRL